MKIEVCYASQTEQKTIAIEVDPNTTVQQAVMQSGILDSFPEIDIRTAKIGIFSQAATLVQNLHAGDRIEIYRPLLCDPKQKRRERAAKNKNC